MGEDNCRNGVSDKKNVPESHHVTNGNHYNHIVHNFNMNGSAISSCSEADSESTTCIGTIMEDQDYQYGPGIVSKLRTKFLSITLKQSRGGVNNMRRSCSLENILEPKSAITSPNVFVSPIRFNGTGESKITSKLNSLKRAKSMDTLLLSVTEEQQSKSVPSDICTSPDTTDRIPKVIRKKDGPLTRTTLSICDEELPKPDTVKTYKRMFEPAESKKASVNSNVRRRPPVLRATAKSGVTSTNKVPATSTRMNGSLQTSPSAIKSSPNPVKCQNYSAKEINTTIESSPKLISSSISHEFKKVSEDNKPSVKVPVNTIANKKDIPLTNGIVKAEPVKFKHKEDFVKRRSPKPPDGPRIKPAIPPNKPSLSSPKSITNSVAQMLEKKNSQNKISPPQPSVTKSEKIEKPVLKPVLVKFNEKAINGEVINNKVESSQNETVSKPISKPIFENGTVSAKPIIIENGIPNKAKSLLIQQELSIKQEPPKLLNGHSKPDSVETKLNPVQKPPHPPTTVKKPQVNNIINNEAPKEPIKKVVKKTSNSQNSMVFDFRGKDVVTHLAIIPAPFGCRKSHPPVSKKRNIVLDGKEPYALNGFSNGSAASDEDDDDYVDYSMPQPCGLTFEGENVRVGKGAILVTRNKDLKIKFDEDVDNNTFIYPSESSYLSDDSSLSSELSSLEDNNSKLTNGVTPTSKLRSNMAIGSTGVGGLMSYTPSVLRTVDNFQPGIFRAVEKEDTKSKDKKDGEGEEENQERKEQEQNEITKTSEDDSTMLKPADPEFISSWSLSANTSDLLF